MRFYWDGLRSITPVMRSYRYVLRSITPVMRFYWDGLRSITPVIRSYRYVLRSITPAVCRIAPNRTACDMLHSYSAVGRDRHSYVLGCRVVIRLCWFTSRLRVSLWRSRRRTKETRKRGGTEETGNGRDGERSRRWGVSALLRDRIGFAVFSAGSTLGLRAPDCAKESSTLWTLFIWVAAWVRFTRRRAFGCNEDLSGLRSFCAGHTFLSGCLMFDHAYVPIGMSYVRSRLLFAACAPNRTACDMFPFCSAVGRDRR